MLDFMVFDSHVREFFLRNDEIESCEILHFPFAASGPGSLMKLYDINRVLLLLYGA